MQEESIKRLLPPAAIGLTLLLTVITLWPALSALRTSFADEATSLTVDPWLQLPGGSIRLEGKGFEPNSNATVIVKNVVATVETQKGDESSSVTRADSIVAAKTITNHDGTIEYALGVPKDEVKVIERWINNSTGTEEVLKTVTTTYRFQGTVEIIVADDQGNRASAELTVLQWISGRPF